MQASYNAEHDLDACLSCGLDFARQNLWLLLVMRAFFFDRG